MKDAFSNQISMQNTYNDAPTTMKTGQSVKISALPQDLQQILSPFDVDGDRMLVSSAHYASRTHVF